MTSGKETELPSAHPMQSGLRSYFPPDLPEREDELNKLKRVLRPAVRESKPRNGEVIGPAGQGKTTAITLLTETLRQHHDVTPLYTDCSECQFVGEIWEKLVKQAYTAQNRYIPFGDVTASNSILISEFEEIVSDIGGIIVVVLDGLDLDESINSLLHNLSRFNVENVKLGSIVISQNPRYRQEAEQDTMSSWAPIRVRFDQYGTEALVSILHRRLELSTKEDERWTTADLESIAERITEEFEGSARAAIEICREACSRPYNAEEITEEHIKNRFSGIEITS